MIYILILPHTTPSATKSAPGATIFWSPGVIYVPTLPFFVRFCPLKCLYTSIHHPPESQDGLWGGEGWISGFRYAKDDKLSTRLRKSWKPQLFNRELYSEILDQKFTVTVTARTLDLIDAAFGFDFYILKTPKQDLNSKFGMDLKRAMLLRLARKDTDLYPDDPSQFKKSTTQQFEIPEEEAEWMGLSLEEAVEKQRLLEKKDPEPLHNSLVKKLVEELTIKKLSEPQIVEKK
uniref:Large ribosomal subunit protein bL28m n=1 Tax=Sinocyclocheilus rhinocerous TaxID=307959 RepID=A0A673K7N7_9TELE